MDIAIIQFPGSNCERETMLAVERAGMNPIPFLWNEAKDKLLASAGCIIVGGFSYEDRGRAGIIASLDPVMEVIRQISAQGKPVLGICNGAQILVESGLVPGIVGYKLGMALTMNKRIKEGHVLGTGFYNEWIYVKATEPQTDNAFLRYLDPKQPIYIPAAHAEGRFILAPGLLEKLHSKNVGMLQYCDAKGEVKQEFPVNPNGSEYNLAAVCNTAGNVMAIMPHPERTTDGDAIFNSMHDYIAANKYVHVKPLFFSIPETEISTYEPEPNTLEIIVDLIITDNTAVSMQKALQNLGFNIEIRRQTHWEIKYLKEPEQLEKAIIASFELFNPNKEKLIAKQDLPQNHIISILIQDKDNLIGKHKHEALTKSFDIENIAEIKQGTLWHIIAKEDNIQDIAQIILEKHILFNPYAHKCYIYNHE
jgi:phosphoribosylformylglycinamidine synthase I